MNRNRPITGDESAMIMRLHHVEGWPVGTIADQIDRHHDTVERVLAHGGSLLSLARARKWIWWTAFGSFPSRSAISPKSRSSP